VLLVVGKKETENRAVSIMRLSSQEQKVTELEQALTGPVAPDVRRGRAAV
jgi:threonyl-tRNA synthetase